MSEHPDAYKHLANNPSYVEQIQQIEQELSNKNYSYIPKEDYAAMEAQLEGDIVGLPPIFRARRLTCRWYCAIRKISSHAYLSIQAKSGVSKHCPIFCAPHLSIPA